MTDVSNAPLDALMARAVAAEAERDALREALSEAEDALHEITCTTHPPTMRAIANAALARRVRVPAATQEYLGAEQGSASGGET
jgi:hypothetical protein